MATLADLIKFLLSLMRDPEAEAAFNENPSAVLADNGLEGVTAQDVRDARLAIADDGSAQPVSDARPPGGNDPVEEIRFTTANFEAEPAPPDPPEPTFVTVDDSDTFILQNNTLNDNDVTIVNDSFNDSSTTDVVAIQQNNINEGGDGPVLDPAVSVPPPVVVNPPEPPGVIEGSAADAPPPIENEFIEPADIDPDEELIVETDVEPVEEPVDEPIDEVGADPTADAVVV